MKAFRFLLTCLLALLPMPAALAICLGSGEPDVEALVREIGRNPAQALTAIEAELARQPQETLPQRLARLASARALAQGMLGRQAPELTQTLSQLSAQLPAQDPALLQLQITVWVMEEGKHSERDAHLQLLAPLSRQSQTSESTLCSAALMMQVLGAQGQLGEAFELGAAAYRIASEHGLAWARAELASRLAQIVRYQSDPEYAIALNTDALSYFQQQGMHDMVANELFLRGWGYLEHQGAQGGQGARAAEADFLASAEAGQQAGNPTAVAYANTGICESRVKDQRYAAAEPFCVAALHSLRGSGDVGELGAAVSYSHYLLEVGRAAEVIQLLTPALIEGREQSTAYRLALQARGRAYAGLGLHQKAVDDLQRSIAAADSRELRIRGQNAVITRARFRSEQLAAELQRKTQDQAQTQQRVWLVGGLGALVLGLLATVAVVMARHRRLYRRLAFTDALTGVANRRYTEVRAQEMLAHAQARRKALSLSVLDLDHFKSCNDLYGHEAGDEALRQFAALARQALRPGDLFGRWGGEEFLLVLPEADEASTRAVLERVRSLAAELPLALAPNYPLRFSAGAVGGVLSAQSLADLLALADHALYQAKAEGRNRTVFVQAIDPLTDPLAQGMNKPP